MESFAESEKGFSELTDSSSKRIEGIHASLAKNVKALNEKLAQADQKMQEQSAAAELKLREGIEALSFRLAELSDTVDRNGASGARGAADIQTAFAELATKVGRQQFDEKMVETRGNIDKVDAKILGAQQNFEAKMKSTKHTLEQLQAVAEGQNAVLKRQKEEL